MRFRSVRYPVFLLYELLRLFFLLRQGASSVTLTLPVTWFAAVPLLALVPILFFMLAMEEERFAPWLPLISLVKALVIVSVAFFVVSSFPTALRFAASGDLRIILPLTGDVLVCIADGALALWCLRRSRVLCR